jgi:TusE/DsrC/DsvC family sulfur relay protein
MGSDKKRMVSFQGKYIPLDEDGHLVNANDWSEGLAGHLAALELAEDHWLVIRFIREYYLRYESVPMPKVIIKGLNKQQARKCTRSSISTPYSPIPP